MICLYVDLFAFTEQDFPGSAGSKEPACQCRRCKSVGSIPGSGRYPAGGHDNLFQNSCL